MESETALAVCERQRGREVLAIVDFTLRQAHLFTPMITRNGQRPDYPKMQKMLRLTNYHIRYSLIPS